MKNWKKSLLIFSCFLLYQTNGFACGPQWDPYSEQYVFFNQNISNQETPYTFLFHSLDNYYGSLSGWGSYQEISIEDKAQEANLNEWHLFLNYQEHLQSFIYESTINDLLLAKEYITKEKTTKEILGYIPLLDFIKLKKQISVIDYLIYAKKCEPHAVLPDNWDYWDDAPRRDTIGTHALIIEGISNYTKCKTPFIQMRYAYQMVRLARYANMDSLSVALYDKYIEPLKVNSIIKYWAMEQKAGALYNLEDYPHANYLFSIVFDQCPSKRISSVLNFKIHDDVNWEACLELCKNPREKSTLYLLQGLAPNSNALEQMELIYDIDPKSDQLELLLVREVSKLEYILRDFKKVNNNYALDKIDIDSEVYLDSFILFMKKIIAENKINNKAAGQLSLAYLQILARDYDNSLSILAEIKMVNQNSQLFQKQLKLFTLIARTSQLKTINTTIADDIYKSYNESTDYDKEYPKASHSLIDLIINRFTVLYHNQSNTLHEYLCTHSFHELQVFPVESMVDELLLAYKNMTTKSDFENYLFNTRFPSQYISDIKSELLEIKGTLAFANNDLDKAINIFSQLPPKFLGNLAANPLKGNINDCRDCDFAEKIPTGSRFTKLTLAKKIKELIKLTGENKKIAAENYYLLGNIYYNMTYFGNSTDAIDYDRDCYSWNYMSSNPNGILVDYYYGYRSNIEYFDCSKASMYYQKAFELCKKKNKELAAKCCFMLAKCEQNKYYTTPSAVQSEYRTNFQLLKEKYSDTQFYKEAIKECKYFEYYVSR